MEMIWYYSNVSHTQLLYGKAGWQFVCVSGEDGVQEKKLKTDDTAAVAAVQQSMLSKYIAQTYTVDTVMLRVNSVSMDRLVDKRRENTVFVSF